MIRTSKTRLCFVATIILGLSFLFFGLIVIPVLPHWNHDVVLTQKELKDDTFRESTLDMLKMASGKQWLFWVISGAAQLAIGIIGLMGSNTPTSTDLPPAS